MNGAISIDGQEVTDCSKKLKTEQCVNFDQTYIVSEQIELKPEKVDFLFYMKMLFDLNKSNMYRHIQRLEHMLAKVMNIPIRFNIISGMYHIKFS